MSLIYIFIFINAFLSPFTGGSHSFAADNNASNTAPIKKQMSETSEWLMTSKDEADSQRKELLRSVLTFTQGSQSFEYIPESLPLGMVSDKRLKLNGETYFLTTWAHGAHTVVFRVFQPAAAKAKPICEEISLSEESNLKFEKNQLKIKIIDNENSKPKWIKCGKKK